MTDLSAEVRKARRARRLGPDASCVLCARIEPEALRRTPAHLLELHHTAGRVLDESTEVVVCLCCHALAHEGLRDAGVPLEGDGDGRTIVERVALVLRGLASWLTLLAAALLRFADGLDQAVRLLDAQLPAWRGVLAEGEAA
jgi:hypothetical protein